MVFVYVCSLQQNATWLLKRNAGKTTQEAIEITHIHHILWLMDQNARLYSRAYALVCLYFSPEAFMLLIWQANQHSCSVTSQITIQTAPVSADSTLKRYKDCIYRVTSCSGSFFALFSLFSSRFYPFSGFQRLGCATAALGRVSAHCSATCAVIGWIAPKRGLPLAGALDWWHNRPFMLCLCILLPRKSRISRINSVSSGTIVSYAFYIPDSSCFKHVLRTIRLNRRKHSI